VGKAAPIRVQRFWVLPLFSYSSTVKTLRWVSVAVGVGAGAGGGGTKFRWEGFRLFICGSVFGGIVEATSVKAA
jgi:hypothetical protein